MRAEPSPSTLLGFCPHLHLGRSRWALTTAMWSIRAGHELQGRHPRCKTNPPLPTTACAAVEDEQLGRRREALLSTEAATWASRPISRSGCSGPVFDALSSRVSHHDCTYGLAVRSPLPSPPLPLLAWLGLEPLSQTFVFALVPPLPKGCITDWLVALQAPITARTPSPCRYGCPVSLARVLPLPHCPPPTAQWSKSWPSMAPAQRAFSCTF